MKICNKCQATVEDEQYNWCLSCRKHKRNLDANRRIKLKEENKCWGCLSPKGDSKTQLCIICSKKDSINHKNIRMYRAMHGLCRDCGKLAITNQILCQICAEKGNKRSKIKRDFSRNLNICIRCHKNKAEIEKRLCFICSKKDIEETLELRRKTIFHYGKYCECCNESDIRFLTLNHVNEDGSEHRKQIKEENYYSTYDWVVENNYPENIFNVLCQNCNIGSYNNNGICPHHKININLKSKYYRLKTLILNNYGNICTCCGEKNVLFLSMDHIVAPKGKKLRGVFLLRWLKRNKFPLGFQILCYNCNSSKSNKQRCWHQTKEILKKVADFNLFSSKNQLIISSESQHFGIDQKLSLQQDPPHISVLSLPKNPPNHI